MENIKKYWLGYLLLIAIIYIGWQLYKTRLALNKLTSNRDLEYHLAPQPPIESIFPKPINGKCPDGYNFLQQNCITTPCEGICLPAMN